MLRPLSYSLIAPPPHLMDVVIYGTFRSEIYFGVIFCFLYESISAKASVAVWRFQSSCCLGFPGPSCDPKSSSHSALLENEVRQGSCPWQACHCPQGPGAQGQRLCPWLPTLAALVLCMGHIQEGPSELFLPFLPSRVTAADSEARICDGAT